MISFLKITPLLDLETSNDLPCDSLNHSVHVHMEENLSDLSAAALEEKILNLMHSTDFQKKRGSLLHINDLGTWSMF